MDKPLVCCLTINFRTQKLFGLKTCNTTWFASFISFARSVGRRWNVAVEFVGASLESVRREFSLQPVAANVEVAARIRQRSHHHQNQPLLIGFEATPPSTWSWEFLFSLDLSLDISRYLSDWFLQICLTFPSVFVRSGRRGWSVKVWGWHWANRTVVTISELWLVGQGRAGLGQMLDRGHHRVLALSCPPLKVDKQAITAGNLGNRIFLMGFYDLIKMSPSDDYDKRQLCKFIK